MHAAIQEVAASKMVRRVSMSVASIQYFHAPYAGSEAAGGRYDVRADAQPPRSSLQNAECAVGEIETLGQYRDYIAKEGLAKRWIIGLHSFVSGCRQLIE